MHDDPAVVRARLQVSKDKHHCEKMVVCHLLHILRLGSEVHSRVECSLFAMTILTPADTFGEVPVAFPVSLDLECLK